MGGGIIYYVVAGSNAQHGHSVGSGRMLTQEILFYNSQPPGLHLVVSKSTYKALINNSY